MTKFGQQGNDFTENFCDNILTLSYSKAHIIAEYKPVVAQHSNNCLFASPYKRRYRRMFGAMADRNQSLQNKANKQTLD